MLKVSNVQKRFGDVYAVDDVTFSVEPGQVVGLLGPNGAGKTTTIALIAGLLRPDSGTVTIDGEVASQRATHGGDLGMAPQEIGLYPMLTVEENLRFFAEMHGLRGARLNDAVAHVVAAFDLKELIARPTRGCSTGERRRVHVGCAVVASPPLVVLDEPSAGLDIEARDLLHREIRRLADIGTALCISSHYMEEIETLCSRAVILDKGRVVASGSVADLLALHSSALVEIVLDDGTRNVHQLGKARELVKVVTGLGDDIERVASVNLVRPSLEAAYLALTGKRIAEGGDES